MNHRFLGLSAYLHRCSSSLHELSPYRLSFRRARKSGRGSWIPDSWVPIRIVFHVSLKLVKRREGASNGRWGAVGPGKMTLFSTFLSPLYCIRRGLNVCIIAVKFLNGSLSNAYMLIRWRHAKDRLRLSTCPDHWFWLMALPPKSHCSPKVVGTRLLTHALRKSSPSSFPICVLLRTQRRLAYLVFHTLFVLLEMISGIGKLFLAREAVKGRYPVTLSSIAFLDWKAIPWKRLENKRLYFSARCTGARATHEKVGGT